jgi:phosphoglycolate phosphatase
MIGVQPGSSVWYVGDTALDMQTAHAAGCTAVLLGDAAHDGGMALMQGSGSPPGLHFDDAAALAAHLKGLGRG